MAISIAQNASMSTSTSQASSYAGTAGTPVAGDHLIGVAIVSDTTAVGTMTGTWTWSKIGSWTKNSGLDTLYAFRALATAATSTTPTIDVTGNNGTGACVQAVRITGMQGFQIRQIGFNTGSTANPSVTMGSTMLGTNACFAFAANGTNAAGQWTPPSLWTELGENTFATPPNSMETAWRTGVSGTVVTWTNANTSPWVAVVFELWASPMSLLRGPSGGAAMTNLGMY